MSYSPSVAKRHRQSLLARTRNRCAKGVVRSLVKAVEKTLQISDKDLAQTAMHQAVKALDSAARKGVISKNAVARKKSRLQRKINNLVLTHS